MAQETQTGALYQSRGVGWGRRLKKKKKLYLYSKVNGRGRGKEDK